VASRLLAFCLHFHDKGRTLRVCSHERKARRYVIEDSRDGKETRQREHPSLFCAPRNFAGTWRHRLH